MRFDGITMRTCLSALSRAALGGVLRGVAQVTPLSLSLEFRASGRPLYLVCSAEPEAACLFPASAKPARRMPPGAFCSLLRRQLDGHRLAEVEQDGFDRVARFAFEGRDELGVPRRLELVAEIMGKHSNLICLRPDGRILDAVKRVGGSKSRVRQVLPGLPYAPPPSQGKLSPVELSGAELRVALANRAAPTVAGAGGAPGPGDLLAVVAGLGPDRATLLLAEARRSGPERQADCDDLAAAVRRAALEAADSAGGEACRAVEEQFAVFLGSTAGEVRTLAPAGAPAAGGGPSLEGLRAALEQAALAEQRRLGALGAELARAEDPLPWRARGEALLARLGEVREQQALARAENRGSLRIEMPLPPEPDATGGAGTEALDVQADEDPVQIAQRFFRRYHEAGRSRRTIGELMDAARGRLGSLQALAAEARGAADPAGLARLARRARKLGAVPDLPPAKARAARARAPSWSPSTATGRAASARRLPVASSGLPARLVSPGGLEVFVGRSARQNDTLLRLGGQDDLWLHARGVPGAHVLLRLPPGQDEAPEADLAFAAGQAAARSSARGSAKVPVDVTRLRFVRRERAGGPGHVTYTGENTILVIPAGPERP